MKKLDIKYKQKGNDSLGIKIYKDQLAIYAITDIKKEKPFTTFLNIELPKIFTIKGALVNKDTDDAMVIDTGLEIETFKNLKQLYKEKETLEKEIYENNFAKDAEYKLYKEFNIMDIKIKSKYIIKDKTEFTHIKQVYDSELSVLTIDSSLTDIQKDQILAYIDLVNINTTFNFI